MRLVGKVVNISRVYFVEARLKGGLIMVSCLDSPRGPFTRPGSSPREEALR